MRFLQTLFASILGTLIGLGVLLLLAVLVVVGLVASADTTPAVRRGSVLVVDLSGTLPEIAADDPFDGAFGESPSVPDLARLRTALRMAAADDRIAAVWLRVGGMAAPWATLEEIRGALDAYKTSGKPLMASGDGPYHGEGDFLLASAADSVFLPPLSFFECNGFQIEPQFFKRGLDRLGVSPVVVRAGTFKAAVEPFVREDLSPENRLQLQALVDAQADSFVRLASARRPATRAALAACTRGLPVMSAEEARRQGMVAGLRTRDEVEAAIARRVGVDAADRLRTISVGDYARTPASAAGLDTDRDAGEIAVVVAEGTIVDGRSGGGGGLFGGDTSVGDETFNAAMRTVREDDDVKAVVLRIASPGGSAVASESMRRAIAATRARKPVVVSMGDYAASGGYWIATASDVIVAQPTTLTGSIGVFSLFFDARRALADRLGVTVDRVATSEHADIGSLTATPDAVEQAVLQRGVDTTYATFVGLVARARKMPPARADSLGQGRVWTGADGRRLGLVDSLGGLRTALRIAARRAGLDPDATTIRMLPRPQSFVERLGASMQAGAGRLLGRLGTSGLTPAERAAVETARRFDGLLRAEGRVLALLPLRLTVH